MVSLGSIQYFPVAASGSVYHHGGRTGANLVEFCPAEPFASLSIVREAIAIPEPAATAQLRCSSQSWLPPAMRSKYPRAEFP